MKKNCFIPRSKLKTMGQLNLAKYSNGLRLIRNKLDVRIFPQEKALIQKHIDIADSYRENFKK